MSVVALAILERRGHRVWAWSLADADPGASVTDVHVLGVDGTPDKSRVRAVSQQVAVPIGAAAWLAAPAGGSPTPCVVLEIAPTLTVLTPTGTRETPPGTVWPVSVAGARPHASGAAIVCARTGLPQKPVDSRRFLLRWEAAWLRSIHERDGLAGATWIDVARLPHQLAVVREVLGSPTVRHVLADEVGLGKTIEALMIWSALSAHDPSLKCVVATPANVVTQWCLEVRRRTEHRLRAGPLEDVPPVFVPDSVPDALDADNRRGLVVTAHAGLPALKSRATAIDMLIVDEAHLLTRDQRDAVESIAKGCKHLLLLTATPREGRRASGAAREFRKGFAWAAGLVDPKWPPPGGLGDDHERALERTVDESLRRAQQCDQLLAAADEGALQEFMSQGGVADLADVEIALEAREDPRRFLRASTLLERVVRSRRRALGEGLIARRELTRVAVEYRREEVAILEAVAELDPQDRAVLVRQACSSWEALAGMSGGRTSLVRDRLGVIRAPKLSPKPDAKLEALLDLCARLWSEGREAKIVIRCDYAETRSLVARELERLLLAGGLRPTSEDERAAWELKEDDEVGPVAILEQGQDAMLEALRNPTAAATTMMAQLAAFERSRAGGAVVLVAGDVAATGLNLQFASALILYDLPWTPGLVEQWVGRLDRVGQRAGVVRIFAMSHEALPTERLLDVYASIGLFDQRGYHVAPEVDRAINDLLKPSENDEASWDQAVARVQQLVREDTGDDTQSAGASLDLPPIDAAPAGEAQQASKRFLEALGRAGFEVAPGRAPGTHSLQWPPAAADVLDLPGASMALRRGIDTTYGSPERVAELRERPRSVVVTDRLLGDGRWLRSFSVSLLSPRHPLMAEIDDELTRDPSLALAGFRGSSSATGLPPGTYLVAQTQTHPWLGGDAMSWRCPMPPEARADEALATLWSTACEALRRMIRVRMRAEIARTVWRLDARGEPHPEPPRLDAVLAALPQATVDAVAKLMRDGRDIGRTLASLERPPHPVRMETLDVLESVADEVVRNARLTLARIVAERRASLESVGEGDAWRGLRDSRSRDVAAAEAMLEAIEDLPGHARVGAAEATTPRVLAAAVLEVLP